jgi:hypothetical protein
VTAVPSRNNGGLAGLSPLFIFVWLSDNRRFVLLILALVLVFVLLLFVTIVVDWVLRRQASRAVLPALDADLEQAVNYARAEKASATRRAYHSDFALFESWCAEKGVAALPTEPETVEGMRVAIRRSKTDQEGKGEIIAIVRGSVNCPVKAVKNWLQATSITEGPLFRSVTKGGKVGNSRLTDKSVAGIIKIYARRIGLNEADFSGHSLRSGFLTSAARRAASVFKMRDVSRHNVDGRVAKLYSRR